MKGPNYIHCVTGEINAILSQMKLSTRYTSGQRFYKEIPMVLETPLMRTFKSLHERISVHNDLEGLDPMEYFGPFLDLVENPETPADLTQLALSSIDKFILYGLVTKDSPASIVVINRIASALCNCRFESTYSTTEESVYQYLLDIILNCIRCDAGIDLTKKRAWTIIDTVYNMAFKWSVTPLLQKSAVNTLTHIILTLFSRLRHPESFNCEMPLQEKGSLKVPGVQLSMSSHEKDSKGVEAGLSSPESHSTEKEVAENEVSFDEATSEVVTTETISVQDEERGEEGSEEEEEEMEMEEEELKPYDISLLHQLLSFLISLTDPTNPSLVTLSYGLTTINTLLEMNGDILGNYSCLVELLQGSFCKYLIQNSQSEDTAILTLTLRVIFNLFQSLKSFLKVQLEVFFNSVHIRLADMIPGSLHDFLLKEASLESLLDFCQEPTVMIDLYTNYDCDIQCTNLYERLCDCLYRNSLPQDKKPLTSINTLAFQGLLAILHSIAQRCKAKHDDHEITDAHTTILRRRHRKKILHEFALMFNAGFKKDDWIDYAIKQNLISSKEDIQGIAELLRETTDIDKTVLGEALAYSEERNPFLAKLRFHFIRTFSFTDMPLDMVLRSFLGTFRIPGEAQAIDRIMDDLSVVVYETNPGPFLSSGALFSLLFSCLLLNTDLHNPGVKNRMTFEDFCRNNRGMNDGQDFPSDYLQYLYESIRTQEIKLLSSGESLDLSHWEQDINYRVNKVSEAVFSGISEESGIAGDCEREMFLIIESKVNEVCQVMFTTSEDEQLLQKTITGMSDYLHITHFFDLKSNFSSILQYCYEVLPSLITLTSSPQPPTPLSENESVSDIHTWKCVNLLRFFLTSVSEYATSLEQEWKGVIDLLFWLDAHNLLPVSQTLLDLASEDNTLFPTLQGTCTSRQTEERGLWNALSSLFSSEVNTLNSELQSTIQDTIQECDIEEYFTKSSRMKVNSWIILFKSLISNDHIHSSTSVERLSSLFSIKLHWMVLLLSKNTDRIGMVWGLVISFLERVRSTAIDRDFKYVLERLIVETASLANIILAKPQLAEQALSLVSLLEPIPPHVCLSTRRCAAVLYLLPSLYPSLTTPTRWSHVFNLLMMDATNDMARPLVWQVLCRLLEEKKVSVINFVFVLKCCLQTIDKNHDSTWGKQIIEYIFALTTYIVRMASDSVHSPQEVIDTVDNIPSVDQCWLQCISVLRSFADGSLWMGEEIAEFAVDRLQRCILRQGDGIPSGVALLKCFDTVMLGLLIHYGRNDREKSYIVGIFVSTLLASSDTLSKQPGFSSYWLRVIDALCKYATQGGSLSETTIERMKNMLLVMSVEGRFDVMSEVAGQNVMEATMTMLDSYCPSIRTDLEGAFKESEMPMEKTSETKEEGATDVSKEEEKPTEASGTDVTEQSAIEVPEQSTESILEDALEPSTAEGGEKQSVEESAVEITEQSTLEECVKDSSEPVATEVVVEQKMDSVQENPTKESTEQSNELSTQEDNFVQIIPDEDPRVQS